MITNCGQHMNELSCHARPTPSLCLYRKFKGLFCPGTRLPHPQDLLTMWTGIRKKGEAPDVVKGCTKGNIPSSLSGLIAFSLVRRFRRHILFLPLVGVENMTPRSPESFGEVVFVGGMAGV